MVRRIAKVCAIGAAIAAIVLAGLGIYGQEAKKSLAQELGAETIYAQQLLSLQAAVVDDPQAKSLTELSAQYLQDVPETARAFASASPKEGEVVGTQSALETTVAKLLDTALEADDPAVRFRAIHASVGLWQAGYTAKIVTTQLPQQLLELLEHETGSCAPAHNAPSAPDSLVALTQSLYQYAYASSLYNARSDVDGYPRELASSIKDQDSLAQKLRRETADEISCFYAPVAQLPHYAVDPSSPKDSLSQIRQNLLTNADATLLDPEVTAAQRSLLIQVAALKFELSEI